MEKNDSLFTLSFHSCSFSQKKHLENLQTTLQKQTFSAETEKTLLLLSKIVAGLHPAGRH